MEEVFLPKIDDFLIDPVEKTLIAFLDGRSDGVKITQGRNADLEALMYQGPGEDFSVVGGEGVAAAVKQSIVGVGVLVVLLQLYLRMILFKVGAFPSRTRKLSSLLPTILGWRRPGKIGSANTPS